MWVPLTPKENPFVSSGIPNHVGGRFTTRQALSDWLHNSERTPFLIGGIRGSGKTTIASWIFRHAQTIPQPFEVVHLRGDITDPLITQAVKSAEKSVTSDLSGNLKVIKGGRSQTVRTTGPTTLLEAFPTETLLVIDEAQALTDSQWTEVAHFLETPGEHSGKVLLVGTPHLLERHPPRGTFGLFGRAQNVLLSATQTLAETSDILRGTVIDSPTKFSEEAINLIHEITGGFPTAVQLYGYYSYALCESETITTADVQRATPDVKNRLASAFGQMTRRQGNRGRKPELSQAILTQLAHAGASGSTDLAIAVGRDSANAISTPLDRLRENGLIELSDGKWRIAVPMLSEHLRELDHSD